MCPRLLQPRQLELLLFSTVPTNHQTSRLATGDSHRSGIAPTDQGQHPPARSSLPAPRRDPTKLKRTMGWVDYLSGCESEAGKLVSMGYYYVVNGHESIGDLPNLVGVAAMLPCLPWPMRKLSGEVVKVQRAAWPGPVRWKLPLYADLVRLIRDHWLP